ncbi:uncharacterized protein L969DRAFT_17262 [Mixia osmundae IAM 14324]|nr:uncharacterized protein L969DRAFT_17262 [Mixia osmundae IAM 14324]KEI39338.1 hypothetical protein L969DRAFT_17262 [Mixia osmundae IAM 14324]
MSAARPGGAPPADDSNKIVLEYLYRRGYYKAEQALRAEAAGGRATDLDEFAKRNAEGKRGQGVDEWRKNVSPAVWEEGVTALRDFIYGSLDFHRPELLPFLLPIFVHAYIDLVSGGLREAADSLLNKFLPEFSETHAALMRMLASLKSAASISESEEAMRWRTDRYLVTVTQRAWSLLLGWMQGNRISATGRGAATDGSTTAASASSSTNLQDQGRDKVLSIVNERIKLRIVPNNAASKADLASGLESEVRLQSQNQHDLKLGAAPSDPKLEREVRRIVKQEDGVTMEGITSTALSASTSADKPAQTDADPPVSVVINGVESPAASDMPPYPASFRLIDVRREVEKVREARKRIKLGPNAFETSTVTKTGSADLSKPSVCLFTLHDTAASLITTQISEDSTLLAAGFADSHIRLWNLKGQPLRRQRDDFDPEKVGDVEKIKRMREKTDVTTRKLIGHSGPVYAISFDPLAGPAGPPRYMLSSSQDSTVRMWSLDTYSCVAVYRGHRDPVWDVEWGPKGVYFASASRDRTARLWVSDRTAAVRMFVGHLSDVDCVKFHPNSLYLATGSTDRTCRLWDVQRGNCLRVFLGHRGAVTTLAFSPDGQLLASAAEDMQIILWDIASGKQIKSFSGHATRINSLSFSNESTLLVSGGSDCSVKIWNVTVGSSENRAEGYMDGLALEGGTLNSALTRAKGPAAAVPEQ